MKRNVLSTKANGRLLQYGTAFSRKGHAYTQIHTKATASFTEISYPNIMSQYGSNSCDTLPQTNLIVNSSGPNMPKIHIAFISTGHIVIGPTGFDYFKSPFTESRAFNTSR